jgi:large subunit ribosomal protein L17
MMLRNMATSLFERERIQTTMPRAKQLRPYAEKLITLARKQDLHARRLIAQQILNKVVAKKLFEEIAKRYTAEDKGGYTRIVAYRPRWGDGAQLAFIELTNAVLKKKKGEEEKAKKGKTAKKKETEEAEAQPKGKSAKKKGAVQAEEKHKEK